MTELPVSRFLTPAATNKVPPKKIFEALNGMLRAQPVVLTGSTSEGYDSGLKPTPCMSFQDLLGILADGTGKNDGLHIDEGIHDTFAAMVAVTFAVKLGSVPL